MINSNDTRWNSQLKMVRQLLKLDLDGVIENDKLICDKVILKSFVSIFEHVEIATDLLQGEDYASISMAIPSYLGIMQHLKGLRSTSRHNLLVIDTLLQSFERRLASIVDDQLYCISATLDPSFKLKWCLHNKERVRQMVKEEVIKYSKELVIPERLHLKSPTNLPQKKSKLFGFLDDDNPANESRSQRDALNKELEDYMVETNFVKKENPLKFWKANY